MNDDWITSPAARRIFIHWSDSRPAWLWPQDGSMLIWRNRAAAFFAAKVKKSGVRFADEPVPIKGQIARLIRLGSTGRSSLARLQLIAGGRPASITATVTPLEDGAGRPILLVVGVDSISEDLLSQQPPGPHAVESAIIPAGVSYLTLRGGEVTGSSPDIAGAVSAVAGDAEQVDITGVLRPITRLKASSRGDELLLIAGGETSVAARGTSIGGVRSEEGIVAEPMVPDEEPHLPMDIEAPAATLPAGSVEDMPQRQEMPLSSLFDRLADSDALYAGLPKASRIGDDEDDKSHSISETSRAEAAPEESEAAGTQKIAANPGSQAAVPATDVIAAVIAFDDDLEADKPGAMFRITGRGFVSGEDRPIEPEATAMDGESRRNFNEIGRILTGRPTPDSAEPERAEETPVAASPAELPRAADRALVNIGAETFILNRLPLGIMVFRDQQVLFANRALTDLVGYATIDRLREAGLAAIFPNHDPDSAGPVTQLVRQDGKLIPVAARLQSVTWQGRPALMLSAASVEPRVAVEVSARGFALDLAEVRGEGFLTLDAGGLVDTVTARAADLLGPHAGQGTSIVDLVAPEEGDALRRFLEPSPMAGQTTRASFLAKGRGGTSIALFAEGTAGDVRGYFGVVALAPLASERPGAPAEDPAMLARISRGVRRPLNTIIGFSDLIRSAAFGTIENHRYLEYARDIRTAGQEIAVLIDELDDYARLSTGTFPVRPAELDLAALLDSCVVRVRAQAGAARVLVRSAISEDLPHIRADRASLGQAILNLLASAIDQTPPNGSVILSAQRDDSGGVVVNVRDSGEASADPGERFVVFRDGVSKDGEALAPVRSSVGLALTRSLLAVNACQLAVTPAGEMGTIFSLTIPPDLTGPAAA